MFDLLYHFFHQGSKPLPAILDFRGAEESHREHLAALLASHGYVTMTTRFPLQTDIININCLEVFCPSHLFFYWGYCNTQILEVRN